MFITVHGALMTNWLLTRPVRKSDSSLYLSISLSLSLSLSIYLFLFFTLSPSLSPWSRSQSIIMSHICKSSVFWFSVPNYFGWLHRLKMTPLNMKHDEINFTNIFDDYSIQFWYSISRFSMQYFIIPTKNIHHPSLSPSLKLRNSMFLNT